MKIELHKISVRDLVKNYSNSDEEWVFGYDGKLNIRPKYQREFKYEWEAEKEVIKTLRKGFPLNIMYWVDIGDGKFEILDGQQRTLSICRFVNNEFSLDGCMFHNLTFAEQEQILNYELMVYFCNGTEREKLDWFKIVNIAGKPLNNQELLNAIFTGFWLDDAKKYFSKTNCLAKKIGGDKYIKWTPINQDYLEKVLKWISNGNIKEYMSKHQHDKNAEELKNYFENILAWIEYIFGKNNYRKEMLGLEWGFLYNNFHDKNINPADIQKEVDRLMKDDDIQKRAWIYEYVLTWDEKLLSIRQFDNNIRRQKYEEQKGICANHKDCKNIGKRLKIEEMEVDHITPWSKWWATILENCQMLCIDCNRRKSNK